MRWQVMAALTNGWLWLLAALTGIVLVLASAPVWFAVGSAALVLLGGATVQGSVEWRAMKRDRRLGSARPPAVGRTVRDPDARALLARAGDAVQRAHRLREQADPDTAALLTDTDVASGGVLSALDDVGRQVDRIDDALAGTDPHALQAELSAVQRQLASEAHASAELTTQRQEIAAGLSDQLEVYARLTEQRTLALERMRSAAIGLEGLAVRLGEISTLATSRSDSELAARDLQAVGGEVEAMRVSLVEAEHAVRQSLRGLG